MKKKLTYQQLEAKVALLELQLESANQIKSESLQTSQFLQSLVNTIPSPIFYKNNQGVYQNCNDAFATNILGVSKDKILHKSLFELSQYIPAELAGIYHSKDLQLLNNPGKQVYQTSVKCADDVVRVFSFYKATVHDEQGDVIGVVGVMLDITELENSKLELKQINLRLETCSLTDPLTGLYNRRKFNDVFPKTLRAAKRQDRILNFAIIDVDNFKKFNDSYGHAAGDHALRLISNELQRRLLRADDYIFRLGGEEFGLLFYANDEAAATQFANEIRLGVQGLAIPHRHNDGHKYVTISLGMVSLNNSKEAVMDVYEKADNLLYRVKKSGKNKVLSDVF
jgi:diguanylate cyclase (GGDEF)-like protein/PAS domain S-box-containing protein